MSMFSIFSMWHRKSLDLLITPRHIVKDDSIPRTWIKAVWSEMIQVYDMVTN